MKAPRLHSHAFSLGITLVSLTVLATSSYTWASDPKPSEVSNPNVTVAVRRLSESEYRHSIADIFGPGININARFEPDKREEGLLAIGSALLSLTSSGFEQYFALASDISKQVLDEKSRGSVVNCTPKDASKMDEDCAREFITHYGEVIFRRPLTEAEVKARLATASAGANQAHDFYQGLQLVLTSLLVAPEFLFRVETAEPDPANPGKYRLDAYTKAARLSFLFWNTTPDAELLDSARSGAIHTEAGIKQQLPRLVASPRFEDGIRAFFADMLQLDGFANMVKDPAIYPKFNQSVADSAKEQMLRTVVDLLVTQKRDYRDLFTSNETFINRPLASVYQVPYASTEEWMPYIFKPESERAGIMTEIGYLALFAHPGTSSPTRRGIKMHEIFMCELMPNPPADVDFSKVKDSTEGTVRGRLLDHMENTGCTVCHRRSDPPGLALEHFDGLGQLRRYENGVLIDVSADFNGVSLVGARGLANYLHDDRRIPACLVRNVYAYGVGRATDFLDESYLARQTKSFIDDGYRVTDLMQQIASAPEFFKVEIPAGVQTARAQTARAQNNATAQIDP